eukprot:gene10763-7491_t
MALGPASRSADFTAFGFTTRYHSGATDTRACDTYTSGAWAICFISLRRAFDLYGGDALHRQRCPRHSEPITCTSSLSPHSPSTSLHLVPLVAPREMLGAPNHVYHVAQAVAHGDGDWARVPHRIREAVLRALAQPTAGDESAPPAAPRASYVAGALPPYLTEPMIEGSIDTFSDAAWVRAEAVRSVAQFHNGVEALQSSMGGHLHALWHVAMQLRRERLEQLRRGLQLQHDDPIPDGVALPSDFAAELEHQEEALEAVVDALNRLRAASVRFTAHFLSDEEKAAMGANPAYLRPEALGEKQGRRRTAPANAYGAPPPRSRSRSRSPQKPRHPPRDPWVPPEVPPTPSGLPVDDVDDATMRFLRRLERRNQMTLTQPPIPAARFLTPHCTALHCTQPLPRSLLSYDGTASWVAGMHRRWRLYYCFFTIIAPRTSHQADPLPPSCPMRSTARRYTPEGPVGTRQRPPTFLSRRAAGASRPVDLGRYLDAAETDMRVPAYVAQGLPALMDELYRRQSEKAVHPPTPGRPHHRHHDRQSPRLRDEDEDELESEDSAAREYVRARSRSADRRRRSPRRGRSEEPAEMTISTTERVRYRNEVTGKVLEFVRGVSEMYDCRQRMEQEVLNAMCVDPRHTSEHQSVVRVARKPTGEQRVALNAVVTSLELLQGACVELVASYLTPEEKRYLGLNTHYFQSRKERETAYQYVGRQPKPKPKPKPPHLDLGQTTERRSRRGTEETTRSEQRPTPPAATRRHPHPSAAMNPSSDATRRSSDSVRAPLPQTRTSKKLPAPAPRQPTPPPPSPPSSMDEEPAQENGVGHSRPPTPLPPPMQENYDTAEEVSVPVQPSSPLRPSLSTYPPPAPAFTPSTAPPVAPIQPPSAVAAPAPAAASVINKFKQFAIDSDSD